MERRRSRRSATRGGTLAARRRGRRWAQLLRTRATRLRIASSLARRSIPHRSFYAALSSDDPELLARDLTDLSDAERSATSAAFAWARKYAWVGRGVTVMTSLLALAAVVTSWPPRDSEGNVQWGEVASGLAFIGSVPTLLEFGRKDVGKLVNHVLGRKMAETAAEATTTVSKLARVGSFLKGACKVIGPIGDAIFICVNIAEALNEIQNEDTVGTYARIGQAIGGAIGLVGGILLLSGSAALTGIGMPLALIGAAIGLIAAFIDWRWGDPSSMGRSTAICGRSGSATPRRPHSTTSR